MVVPRHRTVTLAVLYVHGELIVRVRRENSGNHKRSFSLTSLPISSRRRQTSYEDQDHGERKRNPCRIRTITRASQHSSPCSRNDNELLVSLLSGVAMLSAAWFIRPSLDHQVNLDEQPIDQTSTESCLASMCTTNGYINPRIHTEYFRSAAMKFDRRSPLSAQRSSHL